MSREQGWYRLDRRELEVPWVPWEQLAEEAAEVQLERLALGPPVQLEEAVVVVEAQLPLPQAPEMDPP